MDAKESAQQIINQLPEQASWNDIMYELYVKQKIEAGLKAAEEGRTIPHNQIKARRRKTSETRMKIEWTTSLGKWFRHLILEARN